MNTSSESLLGSSDTSMLTFFGPAFLAPQSSLDLHAALRRLDSVVEMPSLMKSGMGALESMADMPMKNSIPMFMKCLCTSGSVTVSYRAFAASSAFVLP